MNAAILEKLKAKVKNVPNTPGVYLWKDRFEQVIYVGKAKALNKRLNQYLKGTINSYKTPKMLEEIFDFEIFLCGSEKDALALETNYIKQYKPAYNIDLTDDKRYPYLALQIKKNNELVISSVYRFDKYQKDSFYFGPFPTNSNFRDLLNILERNFTYENGLKIKEFTYTSSKAKFDQIINILKFRDNSFIDKLQEKMQAAASNYNYELAMEYRDAISVLENIKTTQIAELQNYNDIDVFSFVPHENVVAVQKVFYRSGIQIQHAHSFYWSDILLEDFIIQYLETYYKNNKLPDKILLSHVYSDIELNNPKISSRITFPMQGILQKILSLANENNEENIKLNYDEWYRKNANLLNAWAELETVLNQGNKISSIFIFDNSHFGLSAPVGVVTCWENASAIDAKSSKFDHSEQLAIMDKKSDVQLMYLTVAKFIVQKRFMLNDSTIFIVDGAIMQINEALYALKEQDINNIQVYGLVKDDNHRTRNLINSKNEVLTISKNAYNLLSNMQYSVDRYAKNVMSRSFGLKARSNDLTKIKGIGPQSEKALLKHFKTYQAIKNASLEELSKIVGLSKAKIIVEEYKAK
ncbi:GIY-YIG nuclease family protein [Mycoplasma aquilae ATCC BAA-1896]|uniref:GIY-YIG nuclease family protein n=1 Tax=Mycoplasma aquilae TaxID=1312741 RepID=UPI003A8A5FAD